MNASVPAAMPACMTVHGKVLPGALEMRHHPGRGYCIVARSDIPAGVVLLQARLPHLCGRQS